MTFWINHVTCWSWLWIPLWLSGIARQSYEAGKDSIFPWMPVGPSRPQTHHLQELRDPSCQPEKWGPYHSAMRSGWGWMLNFPSWGVSWGTVWWVPGFQPSGAPEWITSLQWPVLSIHYNKVNICWFKLQSLWYLLHSTSKQTYPAVQS